MQNISFEDNLRFLKDKLTYQIFYELFKNKNNFCRFKFKDYDEIIEIELSEKFYIKVKKEVKQDLSKSKLLVFTSFLSFIIFIKQNKIEPELSIIFLEDLSFLGKIFLTFNLKEIIKNKEKIFLIKSTYDIDLIINFLSQNLTLISEPTGNIKLDEYDKILCENHKVLIDYFSQKFNELLSDYTTHFIMLPKQIINTLENLKYIQNTIEIFLDNEIPTLVVSAGPSLNKNLELIKNIQKYCYIIAVDTALRILLKNDIQPDLIIALDPQTLNFLDFLGIDDLKNSTLAIEISGSYKIAEKYKSYQNLTFFTGLLPTTIDGEKDKFLPVNPLSNYISKTLSLFEIPIYGNVGLAAISFATKISDKIILAGFDNSFDLLVYHCNETIDIYYYMKRQDYLTPALSKLNIEALTISFDNKKRKSSILEKNENIFKEYLPNKEFINIQDIDIAFLSSNKIEKENIRDNLKIKRIENIFYEKNEGNYNLKSNREDILKVLEKLIEESFKFFEKSKERFFYKIENRLKLLR